MVTFSSNVKATIVKHYYKISDDFVLEIFSEHFSLRQSKLSKFYWAEFVITFLWCLQTLRMLSNFFFLRETPIFLTKYMNFKLKLGEKLISFCFSLTSITASIQKLWSKRNLPITTSDVFYCFSSCDISHVFYCFLKLLYLTFFTKSVISQ